MPLIGVAAAALNQTPLAWDRNLSNIRTAVRMARDAGAKILCLPELCITGYGCEDMFLAEYVRATAWRKLIELAPESRGMIVTAGLPISFEGEIYNGAALLADGRLAGIAAKRYLARDGVHYEPRWFRAWTPGRRAELQTSAGVVPFGDLIFEIAGLRIAFEICEEAWVNDRPAAHYADQAIDVILNSSVSHFAFGKRDVRRKLCAEGSAAAQAVYIYSNLLGCEAGRIIYDGDCSISAGGRIVAVSDRLSLQEVTLTAGRVEVPARRTDERKNVNGGDNVVRHSVAAGFLDQAGELPPAAAGAAGWESSADLKHEELFRSITLGLFDYLQKSRAEGYVISLSGGADSSATAALVSLMMRRASAEIDPAALERRFSHSETLTKFFRHPKSAPPVLTCVYQRTRNSSERTEAAASGLTRALGAEYMLFDIEPEVARYTQIVEAALGRKLSWERDDIALQNVQARARVPAVWMVANCKRALLLTTSNRSEASVGYATMDGDTSGGLCPLGGVDKAFLLQWLRWLSERGPLGYGPIPELAAVVVMPPTAELRPAETAQTDEGDLMPYAVLDRIERLAIGAKLSPAQIVPELTREFEGTYLRESLLGWTTRFFALWSRNQWKRERLAPSFHVDDLNVDPRSWCRFPILSGGFEAELRELDSAGIARSPSRRS